MAMFSIAASWASIGLEGMQVGGWPAATLPSGMRVGRWSSGLCEGTSKAITCTMQACSTDRHSPHEKSYSMVDGHEQLICANSVIGAVSLPMITIANVNNVHFYALLVGHDFCINVDTPSPPCYVALVYSHSLVHGYRPGPRWFNDNPMVVQ